MFPIKPLSCGKYGRYGLSLASDAIKEDMQGTIMMKIAHMTHPPLTIFL
jgi:hypothetical protein